jgi:hypothetical protein
LARECTGFPVGKPMSCKIETIIVFPFSPKTVPYLAARCLAASQFR